MFKIRDKQMQDHQRAENVARRAAEHPGTDLRSGSVVSSLLPTLRSPSIAYNDGRRISTPMSMVSIASGGSASQVSTLKLETQTLCELPGDTRELFELDGDIRAVINNDMV